MSNAPSDGGAPDADAPYAGDTYIRGGASVSVGWSRVLAWTAWICLTAMAAVAIGLTVAATTNTNRLTRLRARGVPVTAQVTGCLGVLSGTGVTVVGFQCTARFTVRGTQSTELIHDSNTNLAPGTGVRCYVLADDPASLTLATAVERQSARWHAFVPPIVLGAVTLLGLVIAVLARSRLRRAERAAEPGADAA
jgi:hypothetical protein